MERGELMAYKLALPLHIKFHDVFHVSLSEKIIYVHDASHIIDWNVIQVEPEEDFLLESLQILKREEIEL